MNSFETLFPSKESKKRIKQSFSSVICEKAFIEGVHPNENDYSYFIDRTIELLSNFNNKTKKYNKDLIRLWAILEMEKYLDFEFRKTINPYCNTDAPISELDYHVKESAKIFTLLDIKLIDRVVINGIEFKKLYLATFEISDNNSESGFRPYVELYQKNNNQVFKKIGYGYDSNNNMIIELFIDNFNYAVYLTPRGIIQIPLTGKNIKLHISDILTENNILKITSKFDMDELTIKSKKTEET